MAIIAITSQPTSNSLKACMRPILFEVKTNVDVPLLYCDVYINSAYIGTFEPSIPKIKTPDYYIWEVDIRDKVQEFFIGSKPATNAGSSILQAGASCSVFCKFRDSALVSGILTPEGPEPVMATSNTPAQPGGGTSSLSFWAMYATLQHESNPVLETHLTSFIRGTWRVDAYPLSHRPKDGYFVVPDHSDYFPFAVKSAVTFGKIRLHYRRRLGVLWQTADYEIPAPPPTCSGAVIGITSVKDLVAGTNTITPNFNAATTEYAWSMPQQSGGALQGPVAAGDSFTTPVLTLGATYSVTITPRCANGVNGTPYVHTFTMQLRPKMYRGRNSDAYCAANGTGDNTGYLIFQTLEEIWLDTYIVTGNTKPNTLGDPDYVAPVYDLGICPLPPPPGGGTLIAPHFGNSEAEACANPSSIAYVSPVYGDVATGATLYQDASMTIPFTGNYIVKRDSDGILFFMDAMTGLVGSPTGTTC